MRQLGFVLVLPVVLLAVLGAWAIRGEYARADSAARREAEHWVELAVQKLDGIEESAAIAIPFADASANEVSPMVSAFGKAREAEVDEAKPLLESLLADPALAGARSETGLPLESLVLRTQLEIVSEDERPAIAEALRASIIRHPSPLSHRLMRDAAPFLPPSLAQDSLALTRETERIVERLAIESGHWAAGESRSGWPSEGDHAVFGEDGVVVTPMGHIRLAVENRVQGFASRLPAFMKLRVAWRGHPVMPADGEALAENSAGNLSVAAALSDPDLLAAELRHRILWIVGLLGAALAVAAAGSWSTWRAFKRQRAFAVLQSDFIASVSHELRTPVTSIGVLAERLESGELDEEPDKVAEYHRFIGREGRRLGALVENVLDFSRIEQGRKAYEFEHADLPRLVRETTELVRPYAEERELQLREEITLSDDAESPRIDALALRQALVNLMDNAIKFTPSGGTVTVGLAPGENGSRHGVRLWVADTGPGIPENDRGKIFERFYRADNGLRRETTGAGIGLSLVKHIIDAHQGRIRVESTEGKGAKFTVELDGPRDES